MELADKIQHIPLRIREENINEGAAKVLEVIRPEWPQSSITFKMLTDGITNKLVGCNLKDSPAEEAVLVRVYGNKTDLLIDRKAETRNIILLNKAGLAPNLYATFENGLAYEFVPGVTLTDKTVVLPEIYSLVAMRMAQLHKVQVPGQNGVTPMLWDKMQKFLKLVPDRFSTDEKHQRFEELKISKCVIQEEINLLKEKLCKLNSPLVFAHNDLLLGNIIYTAEKNSVCFIDFEYAGINYQAFDIGNHFAEFTGIENIDFAKYPHKELQWNWLKTYLSELHRSSADDVSDREIQKLYVQVNQFALAAHLFWGIWALIQAEHSYIPFDFIDYAATRLNEYFAKKETFLMLDQIR